MICRWCGNMNLALPKNKMRRIMMISFTLMTCALISEAKDNRPSMVGAGYERQDREHRFCISLAHAVGNRWSVSSDTWICLPIHGQLAENTGRHIGHDISFQYWPSGTFSGPGLSFGASFSEKDGTGCHVSAAYACRIWKGISVLLGWRQAIAVPLKRIGRPDNGISLKFIYRF